MYKDNKNRGKYQHKNSQNGDHSTKGKISHAPYNFIPFCDKILEAEGNIPGHDTIDPALKTGEIHITMTADTPVFISDGVKDKEHFVKNAEGHYILPGSSVRGMIRSNMQILGFGSMQDQEDYEDYKIFFRTIAAGRGKLYKKLQQQYNSTLDITGTGKNSRANRDIKGGYLCKEGDSYVIYPTKEKYIKVKRTDPDVKNLSMSDAEAREVFYYSDSKLHISEENKKGWKRGTLMFGGRPVNPNTPAYLFPEIDKNENERIIIPPLDALSYQIDWENRKNTLNKEKNRKPELNKEEVFWELPSKKGVYKPVFYIHEAGQLYFGMSLYLRVSFSNPLSNGIPNKRKDSDADRIDFVRAILGYAGEEKSLRSRVFFEDLEIEEAPHEEVTQEVVLAEPKPSYFPNYVLGGKTYNEENFKLRGYKLYWNKEVAENKTPNSEEKMNEKGKTIFCPLPAEGKTVFKGVIHYRNLKPEELGLLLWAIRLEEGCYQNIGKAKPFGYGRMKLVIDELKEFDMERLYTAEGLCGHESAQNIDSVDKYISEYRAYINTHFTEATEKNDIIEDFFYMKKHIMESKDASYMELKEFKDVETALPTVKKYCKEEKKAKKAEAEAAKQNETEKKDTRCKSFDALKDML